MGTRRSKHNLGRKPLYKEYRDRTLDSKAIWDQPDFYEPEYNENILKKLMSEGNSIREIAEALRLEERDAKKICIKHGYREAIYVEARHKKWSERTKQRFSDPVFLDNFSKLQKRNGELRKQRNVSVVLPPEERTAEDILAKYPHTEIRWNQNYDWTAADKARLEILAKANIDPARAASIFMRSEKTIAYKARDLAISIPPEWAAYLPKSKYIKHPREKRILLNYPFSIHVKHDEHADLMAVNELVSKRIPDHMRGDICQDILLAIYEGRVNLESLKKSPKLVREYINRWRNNNLENGGFGIMSLDPFGDDERDLEARIAAQTDWNLSQEVSHHIDFNDRLSVWEAQSMTHHPATQFNDLWSKEIHIEQSYRVAQGENLDFEEVSQLMDEGRRLHKKQNLVAIRIRIAKVLRDCDFIFDAKCLSPAYKGEVIYKRYLEVQSQQAAYNTQYIVFRIPASAIPPIKIRISDHEQAVHSIDENILLDTFKIGVEKVISTIRELANNLGKYDAIHRKTGDIYDVMQEVV